jgi:putative phage-type endonuclease
MLTNDYFDFQRFEDRAGWLEGRRTLGIGSSDAAAILGVSRFKSPLALYYEKLGIREENPKAQEAREWGQVLEGPIARRYAEKTGRFIAEPPAFSVAHSTTYPFAVASCDRFVVGVRAPEDGGVPALSGMGVLEVKNAHLFMGEEWSEENNNEPPIEVQIQLQHQLMVTGLRWGSIAALIGGSQFLWADRGRDEELIAVLAAREAEFWDRVQRRDPPPADGTESSREILRKIYPRETTGEIVTLGPESIDWHSTPTRSVRPSARTWAAPCRTARSTRSSLSRARATP